MTKWNYEYDDSYYTNNGYLYSYDINNVALPYGVDSSSIIDGRVKVTLLGNTYGYTFISDTYYTIFSKRGKSREALQGRFFHEDYGNKLCAVCQITCLNGADDFRTMRISFLLDRNRYDYFNKWKVQSSASIFFSTQWVYS